jgi:formate dehydrogenase major subunit
MGRLTAASSACRQFACRFAGVALGMRSPDEGAIRDRAALMNGRGLRELISEWPVLRQRGPDHRALGSAARSERTRELRPRTAQAERVVQSICPYCAVGCGQRVFVKDGQVTQIEGDPDSPISRGRLCPKGAASRGYVTSPLREYKVKYRRPHGTEWEELGLDQAMDMIADRVIATRAETWEDKDDEGRTLRRSLGFVNLGGATLDNEENYTIKKLMSSLGFVQVENQARI